VRYSALRCDGVRCDTLLCVAVRCSALQCVAVCCSALQVARTRAFFVNPGNTKTATDSHI